ncbi:hypothetical protein COLO4_27767 [Corchorus olitorius]|uniref:Uncharacterized protein n=1 Tax=Corchorus olitorius TaxID=93759 RepID=A0A1R3HPD7_9ROSI|nr:hypothetical protein COLO4_27767 [Corchorus olitorius]
MKFFVLLLIASSMMLISVAPGTQGQECNSTQQCQALIPDCPSGAARCILGRCQCSINFGTKISCSTNAECNKKCDPKCNIQACVNGQCNCGC